MKNKWFDFIQGYSCYEGLRLVRFTGEQIWWCAFGDFIVIIVECWWFGVPTVVLQSGMLGWIDLPGDGVWALDKLLGIRTPTILGSGSHIRAIALPIAFCFVLPFTNQSWGPMLWYHLSEQSNVVTNPSTFFDIAGNLHIPSFPSFLYFWICLIQEYIYWKHSQFVLSFNVENTKICLLNEIWRSTQI